MKRAPLLLLLLFAEIGSVWAQSSPHDVEIAISQAHYADAERMVREALIAHPDSAKAHYILAQLIAHRGRYSDAAVEAQKAATLDPGIHFADPATFHRFQNELQIALGNSGIQTTSPGHQQAMNAPATAMQPIFSSPVPTEPSKAVALFFKTMLVSTPILILLALLFHRWGRRTISSSNADPVRTEQTTRPVNPDYVPRPMGSYGSSSPSPFPSPTPAPSGHSTSSFLAGALTGLAIENVLDRRHDHDGNSPSPGSYEASSQAQNDLRNVPIDMGNGSSWSDNSSASSDSNSSGGFDSGDSGDGDSSW